MRGAQQKAEREIEAALSQAWHMAAFNAATKSKRGLKPLRDYLRPQAAANPRAMLEMIRSMGAKSNMTIKRVKRGV